MQLTPGYLFGLALQTLPEPRKVARNLFALKLPREILWTALALMIILATAISLVVRMLFPVEEQLAGTILSNPILLGVIEAVFMVALAWGLYLIGRGFGGKGSFNEAITTVVWMEFIFLGLQLLTVVLTLFAPTLGVLLMLASGFMFFWILSHFTAESHGFTSTGLVFVSILTFMILAVFALSLVLALLGVQPVVLPPTPN